MFVAEPTSEKADLRDQMAEARKSLSEGEVANESSTVEAQVLTSDWFTAAKRLSIYVSTESEVVTDGIIVAALSFGKTVYIPYVGPKSDKIQMIKLDDASDLEIMKPSFHGIRQYESADGREDALDEGPLDLIIVPALAFSMDGAHLERSQRYYDHFLNEHREKFGTLPYMVGLSLSTQLVGQVPKGPDDYTLDDVIAATYQKD
uniref:5-formyltetrahydrofolate cyclo-ligase n=1 Tax=Panagrellus redivivus TaxID=6233 RepID=A0A7E4UX13_PANRE